MLKNMKIGLRMGLSFGIILLFILVLILIGLNAMSVINSEMETIVKVDNARTQLATKMIDYARETAIDIREIIISKFNNMSDKQINKLTNHLTQTRALYLDKTTNMKTLFSKDEIQFIDQFDLIKTSRDSAWYYQDLVIKMIISGKVNKGADYEFEKVYPSVQQWVTNLANMIKMNEESSLQNYTDSQKRYVNVRTTMIIIGVFAFIMAFLISVILTLSIIRPMKVSVEAASRIASNDLSQIISHTERKDEVGILSQVFRQMVENLRDRKSVV